MKLTLVIGSLSGGGAERVMCNLANHLDNHGHQITLLTVSDKKSYKLNKTVKHISLFKETSYKVPKILKNLVRLWRLHRYIKNNKPDAYITFLEASRYLLAEKRNIKCPVIFSERADPNVFYHKSTRNRKIFNKYWTKADAYVFQTEDAKEFYKAKNIDVSKSIIIPNAINDEFIYEKFLENKEKRIIGVGRLTEQKNFELLIEAFYKISRDYKDYQLIIYGEGPLRKKLESLVNELNLQDRVSLPGYVNNLKEEIKKASIFVLSSNYEGMPNALMEAMALGLAVISTDCPVGGPRYLIKNQVNGILIPVNDVEALTIAMNNILSKSINKITLGKEAQKITKDLKADKIYNQWEEFIIKTVKEGT